MKREREEQDSALASSSSSSTAIQLEIIQGLTKHRSEECLRQRQQVLSDVTHQLQFFHLFSPSIQSILPLSTSLAASQSGLYTWLMIVMDCLSDTFDAGAVIPSFPATVESVRLVANDGTTLVCASASSAPDPRKKHHPSHCEGPSLKSFEVTREVGEGLISGDVVLVYQKRGSPFSSPDAEASAPLETRAELLTLNPQALKDGTAWADAVQRNIVAVLHWLAQLLLQPPGLPQLTYLYQCVSSGGSARIGWMRALSLPRLLDPDTVDVLALTAEEEHLRWRLRRCIVSTFRALSTVFYSALFVMPLPGLVRVLLKDFLLSPLFVDGGFTIFSVQSSMFLAPSEVQLAVDALRDVLRVALPLLGTASNHHPLGQLQSMEGSGLDRAGCDAIYTVLHQLAKVCLPLVQGTAAHPLRTAVENLGGSGFTRELVEWLRIVEEDQHTWQEVRDREKSSGGGSGWSLTELLMVAHRAPTLNMLQSEQVSMEVTHKRGKTGSRMFDPQPHLQEMVRTYDPYRTKDALRFTEASILAAFAEVYGPPSRGVMRLIEEWRRSPTDEPSGVLCVVAAEQMSATASPPIAPLCPAGCSPPGLPTLRYTSRFGFPFRLLFSGSYVDDEATIEKVRSRLLATAVPDDESRGEGSEGCVMGYVLVQLQGSPAILPIFLTSLTGAPSSDSVCATVYALRDGDLMPSMIALAQAAPQSGAWLVLSDPDDPADTMRPEEEDPLATPSRRLLAHSTPALTYVDLIERLQLIRRELLRPVSGRSSSGLWMSFFASNALPVQEHQALLVPSAAAVMSGHSPQNSAPGAYRFETAEEELRDAVPLNPWQIEALRSLSDSTGGGSSSGVRGVGAGQALTGLRHVQGLTGSGKTTLLHAAGLMKGMQLSDARKEQQRGMKTAMQRSSAVVQQAANVILSSKTLDDLRDDGAIGASSSSSAPPRQGGYSSPAEDALLTSAEAQVKDFLKLSLGLRHCMSPLLVRGSAAEVEASGVGASPFSDLLFGPEHAKGGKEGATRGETGSDGRPEWLQRRHIATLSAALKETMVRCSNAPLARLLLDRLRRIILIVNQCSAMVEEEENAETGASPLYLPLASYLFSTQDRDEVANAAASQDLTWWAYLKQSVFKGAHQSIAEAPLLPPSDDHWVALELSDPQRLSEPVALARPVTRLSAEEAASYHAALRERQSEVIKLLFHSTQELLKSTLSLFEELVYGVAAVSQASRCPLLTTTAASLWKGGFLPFLWRWSPSHLIVDDFDYLTDGALLALPAATTTVMLSSSMYLPAELASRRTAPRVLFADLLSTLQKSASAALRTAIIRPLHRCQREEVRLLLLQYGAAPSNIVSLHPDADASDASTAVQRIAGLASLSSVEAWTHRLSKCSCVVGDLEASRFLLCHLKQHQCFSAEGLEEGMNLCVRVVLPFAADAAAAQAQLDKEGMGGVVRHVPFAMDAPRPLGGPPVRPLGCDDEIDVALVQLSGLLQRLAAAGASNGSSKWWAMSEASEGRLEQLEKRLESWLWRVLSRVRRAVLIIADRELFVRLPTLRLLEKFILDKRESLSTVDEEPSLEGEAANPDDLAARAYWLPREVGCAVLAVQCQQHFKTRYIAMVHEVAPSELDSTLPELEDILAEDDGKGLMPSVVTHGNTTCGALCLLPYKHCPCGFHACLRTCHNGLPSEEETASCDAHDCCPFPCTRTLPGCGHLCSASCGQRTSDGCPPCLLECLAPLKCGQRVIASAQADGTLSYHTFPHFQRRRCAEPAKPCIEPVMVTCRRCGVRSTVTCCVLQGIKQKRREQERATESENEEERVPRSDEEIDAETEDLLLSVFECRGCVGVINRVGAALKNFEALPLPPEHYDPPPQVAEGEEEKDAPAAQERELPFIFRTNEEAKALLDAAFAREHRKASLLQQKEGLEISNGRNVEHTPLAKYKLAHEKHLEEMEKEKKEREEAREKADRVLLERLREEVETQTQYQVRCEAISVFLKSEATEEFRRQEAGVYR